MRTTVCALILSGLVAGGLSAQARPEGDEWLRRPVSDATFRSYLSFFQYDRAQSLDVRVTADNVVDGVRVETLSFLSGPGIRVPAHLNHAAGGGGAGAGIVLIHGGSGPGKDSPGYRAFAEFLARAGFTTLGFDLQYFGERRTDLLTTYTETEKHEKLYNQPGAFLAWVTQTVKDAGRAYDVLVERGIDPKRIALVGISRGGQLALIIGGADSRFAAITAIIAGHFDAGETGHAAAACPANYIGRISPRPLLMINGLLDADYNRQVSVEPLQRLAKEPKKFIWMETGHTHPQEETRTEMVQWLRGKLR